LQIVDSQVELLWQTHACESELHLGGVGDLEVKAVIFELLQCLRRSVLTL
jgi:hypothetical protein